MLAQYRRIVEEARLRLVAVGKCRTHTRQPHPRLQFSNVSTCGRIIGGCGSAAC